MGCGLKRTLAHLRPAADELTIIGPYNLTQGGIGIVGMQAIFLDAPENATFNVPPPSKQLGCVAYPAWAQKQWAGVAYHTACRLAKQVIVAFSCFRECHWYGLGVRACGACACGGWHGGPHQV